MKEGNIIKFALIGCGAISKKHVAAIEGLKKAEIVGAYDISHKAAKAFEKTYKIPTFRSVEELVEKTNPDVLSILTPSGDHGRRVLDLLRFKKHLVVEKPLALRLDHIDEILRRADEEGVSIFVVQQNRLNPPVQKLKQAIDEERFGKLVLGTIRVRWTRDQAYYDERPWRGTWANDGGVLTNQASHHIDTLVWLMGEVESVMAKTGTQLVDIETEDTGIGIIKFRNGALGVIEATTAARPKDLEGSISVLGEHGAVEIGGFFMNELKTWNFVEEKESDKEIWTSHAKTPNEFAWNHAHFLKDVLHSISNKKKGLVDGLEGRKSVELINALYESAETGQEIFLRYVQKKSKLGQDV